MVANLPPVFPNVTTHTSILLPVDTALSCRAAVGRMLERCQAPMWHGGARSGRMRTAAMPHWCQAPFQHPRKRGCACTCVPPQLCHQACPPSIVRVFDATTPVPVASYARSLKAFLRGFSRRLCVYACATMPVPLASSLTCGDVRRHSQRVLSRCRKACPPGIARSSTIEPHTPSTTRHRIDTIAPVPLVSYMRSLKAHIRGFCGACVCMFGR